LILSPCDLNVKTDKKAIFAGCAKDCAESIADVLRNIDSMAELFGEVAFVFVENDSRDETSKILERWGKGKDRFILVNMDGLDFCPVRTVRLAIARNNYMEIIRDSGLKNFDYLFVLDMDGANGEPLDVGGVIKSLRFLEENDRNAGCFANQAGVYYDMWALRHRDMCPADVWEEVLDYVVANNCSDQVAFDRTFRKRICSLPIDSSAIEVESAFGGLGIYRLSYALQSRYVGQKQKTIIENKVRHDVYWQLCEHVHFHRMITAMGGRLYIHPWLVNGKTHDMSFPPSAFRSLIFRH